MGWIGLALGAQRAGHAKGAELTSYAAELDWIEEEIRRGRAVTRPVVCHGCARAPDRPAGNGVHAQAAVRVG